MVIKKIISSLISVALISSIIPCEPIFAQDNTRAELKAAKAAVGQTTVNYMKRISFEQNENSAKMITNSATTQVVSDNGNTEGSKALSITFGSGNSSVDFIPNSSQPWVLDNDSCLTFSVKNPTSSNVDVYVTLELKDKSTGRISTQQSRATIPANQLKKITTAQIHPGSNSKKEVGFSAGMYDSGAFETGHSGVIATSLVSGPMQIMNSNLSKISISAQAGGRTIILDNLKTYNDASKIALANYYFLDQYGQSNNIPTTPRKIQNDNQLIAATQKENSQLDKWIEESKKDDSRDQFGGWRNEALKQEARGCFYTTKIDGQWCMIDPEGYPYLSTGLDIVRYGDQNTFTSGRETMFENFPDRNSRFDEAFCNMPGMNTQPAGNTTNDGYNFYVGNLIRVYGSNWYDEWIAKSVKRMKAWGFTGLGNWSDPEAFNGKGQKTKTAYAANIWIDQDTHTLLNVEGSNWGMIADPFDPNFAADVYDRAMELKKQGVDRDPWCVGVFVDNEIHWGNTTSDNLINGIFTFEDCNAEKHYAKEICIQWLKNHYGNDINRLNADWTANPPMAGYATTISYGSFDEFVGLQKIQTTMPTKIKDQLFDMIFDKYYKTVREQVKNVLPNTLYLGSRFADWGLPTGFAHTAAKYCDVVSFNSYRTTPIQSWMELDTFDKPVIIGEFHFNTCENGALTRGLVPTTIENRQRDVENYYSQLMTSNKLVGIHWFQYYDEPILGRGYDSERSDTGFVDVTDQPYYSLVNAARNVNGSMYERKFAKSKVTITKKPSKDPVIPDKADIKAGNRPSIPMEYADPYTGLDFEGNDGHNLYTLANAKASGTQIVTGLGVTSGTHALKYTVTDLDRDPKGLAFKMLKLSSDNSSVLNMGKGITFDVTNPNSVYIQLRVSFRGQTGGGGTYFYFIEPGKTRHITIDSTEGATDKWSNYPDDGWWSRTGNLDFTQISSLNFCIYEGAENLNNASSVSFILDNIQRISDGGSGPVIVTNHNINVKGGKASRDAAPAGSTITITATDAPTGYIFDRWNVTKGNVSLFQDNYTQTDFIMGDSDVSIEAVYKKEFYNVTATAGSNGSINPSGTKRVSTTAGQLYTFVPDAGYRVKTVTINGKDMGSLRFYNFTDLNKDSTIHVEFAEGTGVLRTIWPEGCSVLVNGRPANSAYYGDMITLTADPAPTGQIFNCWNGIPNLSDAQNHSNPVTFFMPDEDFHAHSNYMNGSQPPAKKYAVTITDGRTNVSSGVTGTKVTIRANTAPLGKIFDGWKVISGGITLADPTNESTTFNIVTSDISITATYKNTSVKTFTIHASAEENGTISPSGSITVTQGSDKTFTITPDNQYKIKDVVVNGISVGAVGTYTITDISQNTEITAVFEKTSVTPPPTGKIYLVNQTGTCVATVDGKSITHAHAGDVVTITANRVAGQKFRIWNFQGIPASDKELQTNPYTFTMPDHEVCVHANYVQGTEPPPVTRYTITVTDGKASVSSGVTGTLVNITADNAPTGKVFDSWKVLSGGVTISDYTNPSATFNIGSSDINISATYKDSTVIIKNYTIKASSGENGSISPSGTVKVKEGSDKTFTITPDDGYIIDNVTVNGKVLGAINTYTFKNISDNYNINATFKKASVIPPPQHSDISVNVKTSDNTITNTLTNDFVIRNNGNERLDISKLKICYYYTKDGNENQNFFVDNTGISYKTAPWYTSATSYTKGEFVDVAPTSNADCCLEITFDSNNIMLDKDAEMTCATRVAKENWKNYNRADDYSFISQENVCVYYDGNLIYGNPLS